MTVLQKIIEKRKEFVKLWKEECDNERAIFYKGYACALNWVEDLFESEVEE